MEKGVESPGVVDRKKEGPARRMAAARDMHGSESDVVFQVVTESA
jgi:hypothetical protein